MAPFFSKGKRLTEMIDRYLSRTDECMECFLKTFLVYLDKGLSEELDEMISKTHWAESSSDDIRREIETVLYEKSLIPESRGDILGLLEAVDKIPNKAESVLYQIQTEYLEVPEGFKSDFRRIVNINHAAYLDVVRGFKTLFKNLGEVRDITNDIDKKESESDKLERALIRGIFSAEIEPAQKILLKELVIEIGHISDRAESTADRLNIVAVKQQI